jgi:hypothetical protein
MTKFQRRKETSYIQKKKKTNWISHILHRNCLVKHIIEGKKGRKARSDGKMRKKM